MMYDVWQFCSYYSINKRCTYFIKWSFRLLYCKVFFFKFCHCYLITESIFILTHIKKCSTLFNFLVDSENYWSFIILFTVNLGTMDRPLGCIIRVHYKSIKIIGRLCFYICFFLFFFLLNLSPATKAIIWCNGYELYRRRVGMVCFFTIVYGCYSRW